MKMCHNLKVNWLKQYVVCHYSSIVINESTIYERNSVLSQAYKELFASLINENIIK